MSVRHFTIKDPTAWYQWGDQRIFLGDVLDPSKSDTMSVTFGRYEKGERNDFIVTYDEACILTKGAYTVHSADGAKTAKAGEVIFLTKGTKVTYEGVEDGTEIVFVTYQHWMDTHHKSEHAALLDPLHPV